jgi:hypothetical protein
MKKKKTSIRAGAEPGSGSARAGGAEPEPQSHTNNKNVDLLESNNKFLAPAQPVWLSRRQASLINK